MVLNFVLKVHSAAPLMALQFLEISLEQNGALEWLLLSPPQFMDGWHKSSMEIMADIITTTEIRNKKEIKSVAIC